MLGIKRIYEPYAARDGYRVLVDRLWPRGIAKATAHIDLWLKDIAPSNELRSWFSHEPEKWPEFKKQYRAELKQNQTALTELRRIVKTRKDVTLLFAARDTTHNNAVVLRIVLT